MFLHRRNLAAEDVLLLLDVNFADVERGYQHTDVGTDQEENAEDLEEDISAEQKNSDKEDDDDSACGEPVEREAS